MSDIPDQLRMIINRIEEIRAERQALENQIKDIDQEIRNLTSQAANLIRQSASEPANTEPIVHTYENSAN